VTDPRFPQGDRRDDRIDDRIDPELYGRYLVGALLPDERATLDRWATTAQRHRLLEARDERSEISSARGARALAALRARMAERGMPGAQQEISKRGVRVLRMPLLGSRSFLGHQALRRWGFISTCVVATCVVGVTVASVLLLRPSVAPSIEYGRPYRTAAAEQAVITLRDGTRVILAPSSLLRVATTFGQTTRHLVLVGEAMFDVPNAKDVPFVVRAGATTTRVLGTRFDISSDSRHHRVCVVVLRGKVAVTTTFGKTSAVSAGARATVTDSSMVVVPTADSTFTDWTSGRMEFTHAPVAQVLDAVARWYGIAFRLTDSRLAQQHLTATIDVRHSRAVTLAGLASVLGVHMEARGDTITLVTATARTPSGTRTHETAHWTTTREVGR